MRPLLFLLAITLGQTAFAQSSEYPRSFSDLLKLGDYVGINRNADTNVAHVTVYPERSFNILRDAQKLDENALEEKYPELVALKEEYRVEMEASHASREDGKVPKYKSISVYSYRGTSYLQVEFVGDDYFVVKVPGSEQRGSAVSFRFIQGISWSEDVHFTASIEYITAD